MKTIKNHIPKIFLWFAAMFFFVSIAVYAQDNSNTSSNTSSSQRSSSQSVTFNDDAKQLANQLSKKVGLTSGKTEKLMQVLIDYRNDLAEARNDYLARRQNTDDNQDVTGSTTELNMDGILGDNVRQYYIGAAPSLMSGYREADTKADSKILDLLDNNTQKVKYDQIKNSWWNDVKDRVFTSLNQSPGEPIR